MTTAIAISTVLMLATILLHYEVLNMVGWMKSVYALGSRIELLVRIAASFVAHLLSVGMFAVAFALMSGTPGLGALQGELEGGFADYIYFSITCYTTQGFGEIYASGPMRIVAAMEGLTGLMMIAWSAAFAYTSTADLWHRD